MDVVIIRPVVNTATKDDSPALERAAERWEFAAYLDCERERKQPGKIGKVCWAKRVPEWRADALVQGLCERAGIARDKAGKP